MSETTKTYLERLMLAKQRLGHAELELDAAKENKKTAKKEFDRTLLELDKQVERERLGQIELRFDPERTSAAGV